jgi:hypothetical protein
MPAEYQIYRVPLDAAGTDDIRIEANYFKLLWAGTLDANGRPAVKDLAAMVEVSIGTAVDDYIPMGINTLVSGKASRYRLRWNAQPGKWAFILISLVDPRTAAIQVDAPPTSQIVTQAMGSSVAASAATIGTSASQVVGASGTRQKLTVKNNSASAVVYLGADNAVTSASGFPLGPGEGFTFEGTQAAVWAVASAAGTDMRILAEG